MFDRSAPAFPSFAAGHQAASRLTGLLATLGRRIEASRRASARRQSARALAQLDPHLLRDIGLTRDDLRRALRDPA